MGTTELEKLVAKVNTLEADAVLITGDIFHSPMSPVELAPPVLQKLKPRRFGNFAILGNHDFYAGELRSVQAIKDSGLTLLRDQWLTLKDGTANIHLGGIDDPMANWLWGKEFPDFPSFMKKAPHESGMRILLSHRPNVLPRGFQIRNRLRAVRSYSRRADYSSHAGDGPRNQHRETGVRLYPRMVPHTGLQNVPEPRNRADIHSLAD